MFPGVFVDAVLLGGNAAQTVGNELDHDVYATVIKLACR
jgi:hypothetical protein